MKNYFSENKKYLIFTAIFIIFAGVSYYSNFKFGNNVTTNFKSSFMEIFILFAAAAGMLLSALLVFEYYGITPSEAEAVCTKLNINSTPTVYLNGKLLT